MSHTLVVFHAHPDDEALLTSGTMAKAAAAGHRVVLVVATDGDLGPAESLLDAVRAPYVQRPGLERYAEPGRQEFSATFRTFCGT